MEQPTALPNYFHLAIPINNLAQAKQFYGDGLGCAIGRENSQAIIFNFFHHQLVAHRTREPLQPQKGIYPRHFGLIFPEETPWEQLLDRVKARGLTFRQPEKRRFIGELTEHRTFFLEDPFYNLLEFKFYCHGEAIFGGQHLTAVGDREEG